MKVLLVCPGFPPVRGGVEEHVGRLVDELVTAGHQVEVLTARRGLRTPICERRGDTTIRIFPAWALRSMSVSPRLLLAALLAGSGLGRANTHDVLHVHSYHAANAVAVLNPRFRGRVIFTPHYHGGGHTPAARLLHLGYGLLGRRLFAAAATVICVSRAERDQLLADLPGLDPDTVQVIPNGVATSVLQAAEPWPGEPPTVLSVGRLESYKRVDRVIEAARELPAGAQLVVIGDGSELGRLRELVERSGSGDRVRLLGTVDEVTLHRWLRTAQVLVSASAHEAFGMAPLEAAAAGCRVVLSDIPAHREIASDYLDGSALLVDADDGAALAAALVVQLAGSGRPTPAVPSWTDVAADTADTYRRVVDGSGGRGPARSGVTRQPSRGRRINPVDLPWVGLWAGLAVTPVQMAPLADIRQAMAEFIRVRPDHPLACRLDARSGRWVPVPADQRAAFLASVIVDVDHVDADDLPTELERHRPDVDSAEPLRFVVAPNGALVFLSHAAGNGAMVSELALGLILADADRLIGLGRRLELGQAVSALAHQERASYRAWISRALTTLRPAPPVPIPVEDTAVRTPVVPSVDASGRPIPTASRPRPTSVPDPYFADCVLSNAELRGLSRWRNENHPGASITAVLASRAYRGFAGAGVPLRRSGFYTLFDIGDLLTDQPGDPTGSSAAPVWGNLGKSLYLPSDLSDPASVDAAIREAMASRRVLPALVAGAVVTRAGRLRRPRAASHRETPPERADGDPSVTLTFSSMPTLPGLSRLPWSEASEGSRRYVGLGYPTGPSGLSVFAIRFRDRMEIAASFDRASVDPAAAQRAIEAIALP